MPGFPRSSLLLTFSPPSRTVEVVRRCFPTPRLDFHFLGPRWTPVSEAMFPLKSRPRHRPLPQPEVPLAARGAPDHLRPPTRPTSLSPASKPCVFLRYSFLPAGKDVIPKLSESVFFYAGFEFYSANSPSPPGSQVPPEAGLLCTDSLSSEPLSCIVSEDSWRCDLM